MEAEAGTAGTAETPEHSMHVATAEPSPTALLLHVRLALPHVQPEGQQLSFLVALPPVHV
jgi:hypothetical protein